MRQTAQGEFSGTRWSYGTAREVLSKVNQWGNPYPTMSWTAAFLNVSIHLFADFFSAHSLPLPLSSVVYDNFPREFRKFVNDLYEGGFNLRHLALNSIEVLLSALVIEAWFFLHYGNEKSPAISLKKYEMRASVFGILSGSNIAGCIAFENPFLLNIPVIIATFDSSAKLVLLKLNQHDKVEIASRNLSEIMNEWDVFSKSYRSQGV